MLAAAPRATHYSGDGRTRPDNKLSARWLLVIEWAMRVLSAYAARDISDPIFFRVTPKTGIAQKRIYYIIYNNYILIAIVGDL